MIGIIDYGVGNLFSLGSSLKKIGAQSVVTGDEKIISGCDKLILPGVGAFGDAARKLRERGLDKIIIDQAECGKPLLGICLGMQMLFDKSFEYGEHKGLGLISGQVKPLSDICRGMKIPHMGWNSLVFRRSDCKIFRDIVEGEYVYFVHSFYGECKNQENLVAVTGYGAQVTAAVANKNVFGVQFHNEKSGKTGLKILKAFAEI